jgi:hypothetical protein
MEGNPNYPALTCSPDPPRYPPLLCKHIVKGMLHRYIAPRVIYVIISYREPLVTLALLFSLPFSLSVLLILFFL